MEHLYFISWQPSTMNGRYGLAALGDPNNTTNNHDVIIGQGETSSDGYTLLTKGGDEPGDTGNYDTAYSHYEMSVSGYAMVSHFKFDWLLINLFSRVNRGLVNS
jgi:ABC-type proline/glycine betaine transport system substrate-binding protein